MMQFIQDVVSGAPGWVWSLLVGLIVLGVVSSRERETPLWVILCMPLMAMLSLSSVAALPHASAAWSGFATGYVLGVALGYTRQAAWVRGFTARRVQVRGEWLTLVALMVLFWANFVGATVRAASPELYDTAPFIASLAAVVGAAGGTFLGRTLKVVRLYRAQSV
jgi:hypothetical protein